MDLLLEAIRLSLKAGEAILEVYGSEFTVARKDDLSPLTQADKNSHEIIETGLSRLAPELPLLSEEGKQIPYRTRKPWYRFWMVDPLDGTKEFVKRNGEFTVNIALIEDGAPVLGVVYVPVQDVLYFAERGRGAYRLDGASRVLSRDDAGPLELAAKLPAAGPDRPYTVIGSRSHMTPETERFIEEKKALHPDLEIVSSGSSIKLCLVAEGRADVYPRFAPTMEWDTAAGHAIVACAGGRVDRYPEMTPLRYNKENLLNPWFVVSGKD